MCILTSCSLTHFLQCVFGITTGASILVADHSTSRALSPGAQAARAVAVLIWVSWLHLLSVVFLPP